MHPACRVRLRVECPGFREVAEKYHAELGGESWWRAAYVWLGENHQAPRPLFTSSTTGELEFLLPPGRYMIMAYGADVNSTERTIEVKPGHRLLSLGVVEVSPSDAVKQGIFRRLLAIDPPRSAGGPGRRDRRGARRRSAVLAAGRVPKGEARCTSRTSPIRPTASSWPRRTGYNADPGEVKLWDAKTGELVASLPRRRPGREASSSWRSRPTARSWPARSARCRTPDLLA